MGENQKLNTVFYSIDGSTGKMKPLGSIASMPKILDEELEEKYIGLDNLGEGATFECTIVPKTITKKRFIKLLMGVGHQRNEANKMHQKYMEEYKSRTKIGMIIFEIFYESEAEIELEINIGKRSEL